jgi:hypothetical protein
MFLVVLPRSFLAKNDEAYYPVFCMEIETVAPRFQIGAFVDQTRTADSRCDESQKARFHCLCLQSYVTVKRLTSRLWFKLPKPEPPIDWRNKWKMSISRVLGSVHLNEE